MRDTPRFTRDEIDPGLLGDGLDDAFQGFLGELLAPQLPGIATWSAAGKDGGIDLRAPGAKQTVVEAKVVGSDGLSSIAPRWKKTRDNLNRNLATPDGPPKGQSQYAPWYDKGNPIGAYWFCTTASFANAAQEDKLQKEIETFFRETLGTMPHLDHLADIQVEILGWNKLASQVKPHHLFRWFRQSRPMGLKPLEESTDERRFHAYLTNARLPYYSRAQQLQRHPAAPGLDIPDEQALLDSLADDDGHGMVVVGAGGVGKTRLTLELTWRARDAGWTVLRVGRRLAPGVLEDLAAQLSPADHLIVWLDYVETQADFAELVERIGDLNDSQGLNLRFLASCRTSYLPSLQAVYDYHLVDLSPPDGTAAWLDAHRRATVAHILRQGGLVASGPALTLCGDVPVLAVFLSWLKAQGRTADLQSLLGEKDFGDWLIKRLEQTFPGEGIQPKLATLMGLLPLGTGTLAVSDEPMAVLVHSLAADGWIERLPKNDDEAERWVPPHDVFADQIMIAWLRRIPNTRRDFAPALLRAAAVHDACDSALTSLQRVAPYFGLNSSEWATILIEACRVNPDSWRRHRGLLLRTSLLEPKDKIQLIHSLPGFWENIAGDMDVAMPLGWLCRWATKVAAVPLDDDLMEDLTAAIQTASQGMLRNNFPLTHGLRLAPSLLAGRALAWLEANPTQFQTHFLVVAWLECGLGVAKIRATMQTWAQTYCHAYHLTFLAGAWLDAGGECELVRKPIGSWLDKHAQHENARFVYKAWLNAGGERELVHKPIGSWLDKHAQHEDAQFVYKAWLDAGGEHELVHKPIGSWLDKHAQHENARFVYKAWLDAGGEHELVHKPIGSWLDKHALHENAQFVYKAWLDAGGDRELVHKPIGSWLDKHAQHEDAQFVYKAWLDAGGEHELVHKPIGSWLDKHAQHENAQFVYKAWLDAGGECELVHRPIGSWLEKHTLHEAAGFVFKSWLQARGDFAHVRDHCFGWLHEHRENPDAVYPLKFIVRIDDLPHDTVCDILAWCKANASNEDAIWRLAAISLYLRDQAHAVEALRAADAVLRTLTSTRNHLPPAVRIHTSVLVADLYVNPGLRAGEQKARLLELLAAWLSYRHSYSADLRAPARIQHPIQFMLLLELLEQELLSVSNDRDAIMRYLAWVDGWLPMNKGPLDRAHRWAQQHYAAEELWDRLHIPDSTVPSRN